MFLGTDRTGCSTRQVTVRPEARAAPACGDRCPGLAGAPSPPGGKAGLGAGSAGPAFVSSLSLSLTASLQPFQIPAFPLFLGNEFDYGFPQKLEVEDGKEGPQDPWLTQGALCLG